MDKQNFLNVLDRISNLEQDWNGYGSDPIPAVVIEKARNLLDFLPFLPDHISPMAGGQGVQFEWYDEDDNYLEIEIREDRLNFCTERNNVDASVLKNVLHDYFISLRHRR